MTLPRDPLDLSRICVFPLAERRSLASVEEILLDPDSPPPSCSQETSQRIRQCAAEIRAARKRDASVVLIFGAHLVKNGAALLVDRLLGGNWVTHLATNGAGTIHDWEFSWFGRSTESVAENVLTGTFGTWDETGRNIHLALLAGGIAGEGYGRALGRFIWEDGVTLPDAAELERELCREPRHPAAPARADVLQAITRHQLAAGWHVVEHRWKRASILAQAFRRGVPMTVHPGIGYDIISNHPMFNGAVIGRAAEADFCSFGAALENLDGGVVLSVGSAIMGPQVFEKSLSCVNNIRLQEGRPIVRGHSIHVVDLQDGGNWDWTTGEPPKDNPAYYLRFCKSYSRMGGAMQYLQCDNTLFLHALLHELKTA